MTDLRTLLADTADSADTAPPAASVDADLARGRRGLRRHRLLRAAPSAALTVVAASVLAVTLTPDGQVATAPGVVASAPPSAAAPAPTSAPTVALSVRLVAFTGEQPAGYTLEKVPAGWVVSDSTPTALVLAPEGVPDTAPGSFVGKIAVSLQASVQDPQGTVVDVAGARGVLVNLRGGGSTLFVQQPDGMQLGIQVWEGLGWDAQQIVEFAVGVHVTAAAEPVFG